MYLTQFQIGCSLLFFIFLADAIFVDSSPARPRKKLSLDDPVWDPEKHVSNYQKKGDNESPAFKRLTRLYSKSSGRHVRIHQSGRVDGAGRELSELVKLSIESATFGTVSIRGVNSGLYLCMNKNGRLVGRKKKGGKEKRKKCMYKEIEVSNGYLRYQSVKYPEWYIGINRRGKAIAGPVIAKKKKFKVRHFLQRDYDLSLDRRYRRTKKRRQRLIRKNQKQS